MTRPGPGAVSHLGGLASGAHGPNLQAMASPQESEDKQVVDLSGQHASGGAVEAALVLPAPRRQILVRHSPGSVPGRAEATHDRGSRQERWNAKHFWRVDDETVAYEFDEPLPAGEVRLRVPLSSR